MECSLFGWFGGIVQLSLGALCISSLICNIHAVKRYQETPRRPWAIFLLVSPIQDISKQVFSALLAHSINLASSEMIGTGNPCVWYFVNIMLDTTIGVLMSYLMLRTMEYLIRDFFWFNFFCGKYYDEKEERFHMVSWSIQVITLSLIHI